jgi:ABC-type multidrug transport system permease subunit
VIDDLGVQKKKTGNYLNFGEFAYYNWRNWGFFMNAIGLTLFLLIISYSVIYMPDTASND